MSTTAAILAIIPIAIALATSGVIVRKLQHVNNLVIVLYYGLVSFAAVGFIAVILSFSTSQPFTLAYYDGMQWLLLITSSIVSFIGLFAGIIALKSERTGIVIMFRQADFFYAFLFDIIIFSDTLYTSELFGVLIVIASLFPTLIYRAREEKKKAELEKEPEESAAIEEEAIKRRYKTYF